MRSVTLLALHAFNARLASGTVNAQVMFLLYVRELLEYPLVFNFDAKLFLTTVNELPHFFVVSA